MSFYDDASLILLAGAAAGKDGKAYNVKPVPEYGPELVTNGDFATDSDWDKSSSWSIGGGVATYDKLSSGQELRQLMSSIAVGKTIEVKFDISNIEATKSAYFKLDCSGTPESIFAYTLFSEGTYTYRHTITGGFNRLTFTAINSGNGGAFSIDNISVKEVTNIADFDFSRGSNLSATRVGPTGLIEKGRENLLLQSNQFEGWNLQNVTSGHAGYDGTNNAYLQSGTSRLQRNISLGTSVYTGSVYVKAGFSGFVQLYLVGSSNALARFELTGNGTIVNSGGISPKIEPVSGATGWYRISTNVNGSIATFRIYPQNDSSGTQTADSSIYVQDAQLEIGLAATEVIETGVTTGKAGILENEPRFDYSGGATCPSLLLEPSRTQLVTQTEYFGGSYWTNSGTSVVSGFTSPEGLSNAYKLVEDSANSRHFINSSEVTTPDTTYSSSVYIKANGRNKVAFRENSFTGKYASFNLSDGTLIETNGVSASIESASNGWYRINYELTSGNNYILGIYLLSDSYTSGDPYSSPYQGDGTSGAYIYGAQLESASYPTSYIPNHSGGSVTRGDERTTALTLPETLTDNYTLFFDFKELIAANGWISFLNSSNSAVYTFYSYNNHYDVYNSSSFMVNAAADPNGKIALKQSGSNVKIFVNGEDRTKAGAIANLADIEKFAFTSKQGNNSGVLKQMLVFSKALSDADCITLTGTSYDTFADMAEALNYTVYE